MGAWAIWAATLAGYVQRWAGFRLIARHVEEAAVYKRLIAWLWRMPPTAALKLV